MSTNFCRIWSRIGFRIKISQCIKPINFSSALEKYFRIYFSQLWEYQEQHQLPFLPNYIAWLIKTTVEFDRHHDHPHSQFNLGVIDAEACLFDKVGTLLRLLGFFWRSSPGPYNIAGLVLSWGTSVWKVWLFTTTRMALGP